MYIEANIQPHSTGFQPETRTAIPSWDILLFTYSILSIPVLLGLLVGLNLLVWSDARINYIFIFGLFTFIVLCEMLIEQVGFDVRTRLDHRAYPEVNQKNIIVADFFPLTCCSDPGNPSRNTRLRILVFFL
jgi:hypothetical protein